MKLPSSNSVTYGNYGLEMRCKRSVIRFLQTGTINIRFHLNGGAGASAFRREEEAPPQEQSDTHLQLGASGSSVLGYL